MNLTDTAAKIRVNSTPQEATFIVGQEKNFDLTGDGFAEIAIKLQSINILTKKATLVLSSVKAGVEVSDEEGEEIGEEVSEEAAITKFAEFIKKSWIWLVLAIIFIIAFVVFFRRYKQKKLFFGFN